MSDILDADDANEHAALRKLHENIRTEAEALFAINPGGSKMPRTMTLIGGCDPGVTGAICVFNLDDGSLRIYDMPRAFVDQGKGRQARTRNITSAVQLGELMAKMDPKPDVMWLEDVAARPGQGVSSMFTFGRAVGVVEGVMGALSIPVMHVTPGVWMKDFGVVGKSSLHSGKAGRVANSRALASSAFPEYAQLFSRVKDNGRADATLIALYGAKHATGKIISKYRGERLSLD